LLCRIFKSARSYQFVRYSRPKLELKSPAG
jgi:hypothetical protein